jgi:sterol desaturase/sphingolipid hydroxylase (fatty acid hydroxylase superfamily)
MSTSSVAKPSAERRFVSNRDETCRMFRSDWLEALSHVHPAVPHILYLPLVAFMLWLAARSGESVLAIVGLVVLGALSWTLTEYVIHRFVFHAPPQIEVETQRIVAGLAPGEPVMPALPTQRHRFYFLVHGVHHDYPNDSGRLVMPPSASIPLAFIFYGLFVMALGPAAPAAFAGFVAGYLFYDTTHYYTHHGRGHSRLGRYQKRRHFRHHYADDTRDYGVSTPLWDAVLGTLGRGRARSRS